MAERELRAGVAWNQGAGERPTARVDHRRNRSALVPPLRLLPSSRQRAERSVRMVAAVLPERLVAIVDAEEYLDSVDERVAPFRRERAIARPAELDRCERGARGEKCADVLRRDRAAELAVNGLARRRRLPCSRLPRRRAASLRQRLRPGHGTQRDANAPRSDSSGPIATGTSAISVLVQAQLRLPKMFSSSRKTLSTSRKIDAASNGAARMSLLRRSRWKSTSVKPAKITSPRIE